MPPLRLPSHAGSRTGTESAVSTPRNQQTREYSCVLCKRRKVRCDRSDPCAGCNEAGVECIATTRAPYRRRRRANVDTESNQQSQSLKIQQETTLPTVEGIYKPSGPETSMEETVVDQAPTFGQDLWRGLKDEFRDPRSSQISKDSTDAASQPVSATTPPLDPTGFFFASSSSDVDLRGSHPSPPHAWILWQVFLENVNPLSKLIYVPQLQDELLTATKDFGTISNGSISVLFSIYAAAVTSMKDLDCQSTFGESRNVLLNRYITATQHSLAASGFLKSLQLVVLQAFVIYLLSARQIYDPQTIWLLTGMAIRMGQRIGLSEERPSDKFTPFEVQIRRRVWWQILLIDSRSGQLCGTQAQQSTAGTYNFPLPANLNDADINPNMIEIPMAQKRPTEMIFCLLRYEFGKFLNANGRKLHGLHMPIGEKDQLIDDLENYLECNFLRYCDPAIPLHLLSVGGARSGICKLRLVVHHPSQRTNKGATLPQSERHMLFSTSLKMVEYDVLGQSTKELHNFSWHLDVYFQIDAFVFMLIELCNQISGPLAEKAWNLTSEIYKYRRELLEESTNELYAAIGELTIHVWETKVREFASQYLEIPEAPKFIQELLSRRRTSKGLRQIFTGPAAAIQLVDATRSPAEGIDLVTRGSIIDNASYESGMEDVEAGLYCGLPPGDAGVWEATDWDYWNHLLDSGSVH